MDLVSRIERYMEYKGVSRSQFADTCGIPRPTLTQLLNGHNKKVSDDLLKRIHASYPDLSIMWLVFGEGEMLVTSNNQFSEGAKAPKDVSHRDKTTGNEPIIHARNSPIADSGIIDFAPELENSSSIVDILPPTEVKMESDTIQVHSEVKKIRHIMVFYSDNSYELFTPSDKH